MSTASLKCVLLKHVAFVVCVCCEVQHCLWEQTTSVYLRSITSATHLSCLKKKKLKKEEVEGAGAKEW